MCIPLWFTLTIDSTRHKPLRCEEVRFTEVLRIVIELPDFRSKVQRELDPGSVSQCDQKRKEAKKDKRLHMSIQVE